MIDANDLVRGTWISMDDDPWVVMSVTRQTPTARGASMLVKTKLRNGRTGNVQDKSFKGSDKLAEADVDDRPIQYLYRDAEGYHFMDQETYDQFCLTADDLGDAVTFLVDNLELKANLLDEKIMGVDLPAHVDLRVTECPPPISGATSGNKTKIATLETGREVHVPDYLTNGELVRVDTRDGRFVQRVKEG